MKAKENLGALHRHKNSKKKVLQIPLANVDLVLKRIAQDS
jgi:hypothetical protein